MNEISNGSKEQLSSSNYNFFEKKKKSLSLISSHQIKINRSESLATANIPMFSVLQAQLKKNKILNEGKNNESDRLKQLNEDLETERDIEWKQYLDEQDYDQRNAILMHYLQQKTKFGEFVDPADLFFKDSFPPLKAQLYPRAALNKADMKKRLFFNDLIAIRINAICDWKLNDEKGKKKKSYIKSVIKENDNILVITEKDAKEILDTYEDTWPCLNIRKSIWRIFVIIRDVTAAFISTKIFENGCILVIVLNCFAMMTDDPTALVRSPIFDLTDNIFLAAYTFEMASKIIGLGFFIGENAYLKDPWNMLDLLIVGSAYMTLFTDSSSLLDTASNEVGDQEVSSSFDLKGLRVFRVLRPLKTISTIKGLKVLVSALFAAIPLLRDTIFILFCYFIVFAITGVQMLSGLLKNRCVNQQTGIYHPSNMICGQYVCPHGYFCGKTNENPHFGLLNFDNVMYSLMAVFQSVTLQGWSEQEVDILRAYSDFMILYFVPLVYIGSFFFLNLTLAVINSKFTESHNQQKSETKQSLKILLNPEEQVEIQFIRNLKDEINILANFHLRKIAAQMVRFLRIKQAEKTKTSQPKIVIAQENKDEIKSILSNQKSENRQGETKTVAFQDEAEQIESNDLQPKKIITSASKLDEVEEKDEEYLSDQEKKDKEQSNEAPKEPSLNENQQVIKEENKYQQQSKPVKTLKLTNQKINQMKTQAIYNIQMISPAHNVKNNSNYEKQDFKMKLKMKGNEGLVRQILAKKKFQEDEKKQIKIQKSESISDKNLNFASLLPQSILTEEFVNNELNFDKIIPINFRPPKQEINLTDKEEEEIVIFDDRFQNKQKDDKLLNFSDIDEESGQILKGTDYNIQEKSFQISEHKNSEEISNSINSLGINRTDKSQFPNEKIQINTPRSALYTAIQLKENIKEKFLNAAFFKNDQDNESDESILSSFRQTQDNSKDPSQATQQQYQNSKMKVFDDKKQRTNQSIKNSPFVQTCPQNVSKAFRNIIQTQVSLSKRGHDNFRKIIIDEEESEQPQVDLLFKVDQDEEEVNYHIENKIKAKKNQFKNKKKNENKVDTQFGFCFDLKKKTKNGEEIIIKKLEEKILKDKPEDVFALMDKLIQKCMIMPQINYKSFSQQDLTEERKTASQVLSEFLQHQQEPQPLSYGVFEPELQRKSNNYLPFQQKVIYEALEDSSELEDYVTSSEEEYWRQLKQPYQTLQNVAYFEQLKQLPLKEITRRSDIVATSTFSSSVFPIDKRKLSNVYRVLLDNQKIVQFQDECNIFKALCQEQKNQDKIVRDKDKLYNDNYIRSFIYKTEFSSETLKEFKQICQKLNCNQKEIVYKSQQELFDIQIRFQQNLRASEKRGVPRMNYEIAQQIVNGKYHDQDEENEQNGEKQGQLSEFQKEMDALSGNQNDKKRESEIPKDLRLEFNIPEDMEGMELNFGAIKRMDFDRKKNRHVWSGQDVMPERLNYSLSQFIVENINSIRVWPRGFKGIVKRGRIVARLIIFSSPFDAFFTFLVIVNTVVLSLNFHGISVEMNDVLASINDQLTKLFIIELAFKLLGLGPIKYVADRMHILDATIVLISIFEMIYSAILPGGANFKAFSTLRMLRTFRVIRLVRLLKGMQGMQVIIAVIGRSYKSTIYISVLLLVFIFIFALLGMQFFGGKLNYQEGLPQNNFDNFKNAAIAVFCVLTMETWPEIFFDTARGDLNKFMVALFFVAWIFIGNFIILNLFISVLLDSYLEENDEEEDQLSKEKALEIKQQRKLEKKKLRQRKIVLMIKNSQVQTKVKEEDEAEEIEDLDEEEIVKIFKNQGFMKKDKIEEAKVELFIGVECQSSFFLFKQESPFRILCYKLVHQKFWDRWVMALIFLSSIKLALDTYLPEIQTSPFVIASFYIDYFLNFSFILEMITKQIAIGFIMDKGSYLSESWNCLDFFIVMSSIADMSLSFLNIKFVKILRLLRTLRPLRVITHNVALRMIVVALLDSVANIFNVLLIVLVVWLMFGIMGVNFFGGKFSYCSIDMYKLLTKLECEIEGGLWVTYHQNFDNVFQAVSSLFIVSTLEGWVQVMFQAIDSYDVDQGPQKNASTIYALYFIGFVIVGSFFFLNFFIGVLFLRYNQAQKQELEGFSKKDIAWLDIQKLILESEPEYETINVPESPFRQKFHSLVCNSKFENTIMGVICINMLSMAIQMENQSALQTFIIGNSNYAFTAIFIIEGFLKFVAFGFSYFENGWNRFDFFVICAGILDILIQFLGSAIQWLSFAPQVSRIFRIIRLTRIVKLFGKAQGLQALVQTMIFSVSSFTNVVMLLTLVYFMFAILGVFLFSEVTQGDIINEYKNFSAFWPSLFTLLAVSTGENWNLLLYDLNKTPPNCIERATCGTFFSLPYFFSLIILLQWVMFNLFILIVIEQFEKYYLPKENIIKIFKNDYVIFMDVWKQFTMQRYKCLKIKENQLIAFFHRLGDKDDSESSLGFSRVVYDEGDVKKFLLKMSIRSTDGFICFNELLYRAMRRKYGNFKIGKKMQVSEYQTQFSIYHKMAEQNQKLQSMLKNDEIQKNLIKKENGINPFLTSMSYRLSFRTWFKVAKSRLKKKAVILLEKSGNIDMLDKDKLADPPQILTSVDICQEDYFSFTSEDENFTEMSLGKSLISSSKKQESKASHLEKFEKAMIFRIQNSIPKDSPLYPFIKNRIQQNTD